MGLVKAALGAASGVMGDQWKEYFYCSDLASLGDVYRFFMRAEDNILQKKVK